MSASKRTIVTGFLQFDGIAVNPSAQLAESSDRPFKLIEVSYDAVDRFVDSLSSHAFDRLVLMGVAVRAPRMRIERVARNVIGERLDVRGYRPNRSIIEPNGPASVATTLFNDLHWNWQNDDRRPNDDCGSYLCNYIYYRALRRFPSKRIGFVHVTDVEHIPLSRQATVLADILDHIEQPAMSVGSDERTFAVRNV